MSRGFVILFIILAVITSVSSGGLSLPNPPDVEVPDINQNLNSGDEGKGTSNNHNGAESRNTESVEKTDNTPENVDKAENTNGIDTNQVAREIHKKVNIEREKRKASKLSYDEELAAIATDYSNEMAERGFFSHDDPDGQNFADRYAEAGYNCRVPVGGNRFAKGAENLFRTSYKYRSFEEQELADLVVTNWLDSPSHRETMLNTDWRREGIGVAVVKQGSETSVYVTQNFC